MANVKSVYKRMLWPIINSLNVQHLRWTDLVNKNTEVKWSEVARSCPTLCDPMDCILLCSSVHGIFQAKSTGVGCHFLLQRISLTQGSNPGLPHCRQTLYRLSHQGNPKKKKKNTECLVKFEFQIYNSFLI